MMTKNSHLLLPFLAFLSAETVLTQETCVPCEGDVDPTLSFDGVPCENWLAVAGASPSGTPQCTFDRMVGIWFCGCPVPEAVNDTCTLCKDGSVGYNKNKTFPESAITCDQLESIPAIDGELTCIELSLMGDYCGCPASTEMCQLCPDGGEPTKLDNMFLTTGDTCQYALEILQVTPASNCNMYFPDMMVDLPSFCGCPEAEAPKTCSLCPDGLRVEDPDRPLEFIPGSTCADFETYSHFVNGEQLCSYMLEIVAAECCEGFVPATKEVVKEDCNFCPDGNQVTEPDRLLMGLNITCGELANRAREDNSTDCPDVYQTNLDMLIDTGIYCGCPEIEPTDVCSFCPLGQELLYPEKLVTKRVNVENATCAQYASLADSTFDDDFCSAVRRIGMENECCGVPEEGELGANNESYCHLCGLGASVQDGNKTFLGTSLTCETYQNELAAVPKGGECDGIIADFTSTFDPSIYCKCPESEPTGACSLCPEGTEVVDPSIVISDIYTTCGQIEEISKATVNRGFCSSLQTVGQFYCCYSPVILQDGKRHLRKQSDSTALKPFHHRTYHFAALKAIENVTTVVSGLVDKQNLLDFKSDKL